MKHFYCYLFPNAILYGNDSAITGERVNIIRRFSLWLARCYYLFIVQKNLKCSAFVFIRTIHPPESRLR